MSTPLNIDNMSPSAARRAVTEYIYKKMGAIFRSEKGCHDSEDY
jgi:hypothetical protein